jgi:multidrug transporter EmrE-like cation transporter
MHSHDLSTKLLQSNDYVVIITDHGAFPWPLVAECNPLVVDTRNALGYLQNDLRIFRLIGRSDQDVSSYASLACSGSVNALGNVLIKYGMNRAGALELSLKSLTSIFMNPGVVGGMTAYVFALAGYSYTLSRIDLSVAYPIMSGLSFLLVLMVSALFLKESIQPIQLLGCVVILTGVWLVSLAQT